MDSETEVKLREIGSVFELVKSYNDEKRLKTLKESEEILVKVVLRVTDDNNYRAKLLKLIFDLFERRMEVRHQEIQELYKKVIDPLTKVIISSRPIIVKATNELYDHSAFQLFTNKLDELRKVPMCPASGKNIPPPVRVKVHKESERNLNKLYHYLVCILPMINLLSEFLEFFIPFGSERSSLIVLIVESPSFLKFFTNTFLIFLMTNRTRENLELYEAVFQVTNPLSQHSEDILQLQLVSRYFLGMKYYESNDFERTIDLFEEMCLNHEYERIIRNWDKHIEDAKIEFDRDAKSIPRILESFALQELILSHEEDTDTYYFGSKYENILKVLFDSHRELGNSRKCVKFIKIFGELCRRNAKKVLRVLRKYVTVYLPSNIGLIRYFAYFVKRTPRLSKREKCECMFRCAEKLYQYELENRIRGFKGSTILLATITELEDNQFTFPETLKLTRKIEKYRKEFSEWEDILAEKYKMDQTRGEISRKLRRKCEAAVELGDPELIIEMTKDEDEEEEDVEEVVLKETVMALERNLRSVISKMEMNQLQIKKTIEEDWGLKKTSRRRR